MNLPEEQRAKAFEKLFGDDAEYPCDLVTETFFAGMEPRSKDAFWSVGCRNGKSYQITIKSDAGGSTRVLSCGMLKLVAKLDCFKPLAAQR